MQALVKMVEWILAIGVLVNGVLQDRIELSLDHFFSIFGRGGTPIEVILIPSSTKASHPV